MDYNINRMKFRGFEVQDKVLNKQEINQICSELTETVWMRLINVKI